MPRRWMPTLLLALCITGCSNYHTAHQHITNTRADMAVLKQKMPTPPPVVSHDGFFIRSNTIPLKHTPSWMQRAVEIHAEQMPLDRLLNHLLSDDAISVEYDPSINPNFPVTLHYRGSLLGALRHLEAKSHYHYQASEHLLRWSAFQTKTFDISFMPGASTYLVGADQNQASQNPANNTNTQPNELNDQQYSKLQGALSVWQDVENTLNQLKSPEGKIVVSESTTSVTVSDHPSNLRAIARYIRDLNRRLSQQVAIKVQVLEVNLNKTFNYGLNWDLLAKTLGTQISLHGHAATATNLVQSAAAHFSVGYAGSEALINALGEQGEVRVVTEPEVTTLNNQIAAIRITQQIGYIQSVSQTSNQFSDTSAINPGSITDGFTLYLLPKIQHHTVYLQISSTMANLEKLEKVSTAPTELKRDDSHNAHFQAIQVPTLSQKSFNQRSLIPSGATLIIAGYKQLRDETSKANLFGVDPLGGKGAISKNTETLVLITPIILEGSQHYGRHHP